jgi:arsenite methyltransferase
VIATDRTAALTLRALMGDELRPGGLALTDRALALCRFPKEARIVDVGCGWGGTVRYLCGNYGYHAIGIDLSAERLLWEPRLPALCATALALPIRSGIVDGLFCECVLSLLSSPERALSEFQRILRPRGHLVLSDLYLRDPTGGPSANAGSSPSCLAGAVGMEHRINQLRGSGMEVLVWEDHSRLLAQLAAKIVWGGGSLKRVLENLLPPSLLPEGFCDIRSRRPSYYFLIARKNEKEAHERPDT